MLQDAPLETPAPEGASPVPRPGTCAHVAIGPVLHSYQLEAATGILTPAGRITLPSRVQYAWPHPALPVLYTVCADRSAGAGGQPFYLCALAQDAAGGMALMQPPITLPSRPIHVTTDSTGHHVLTAYSHQPGLTVHRLGPDGRIGDEIPRADGFDMGTNPHQVRVLPGDAMAVLVARGRKGVGTPAHVQGGLNLLHLGPEALTSLPAIQPGEVQEPGGFNPRHLDFHPTLPFAYVVLEEQNRLSTYRLTDAGIEPAPLHSHTTLADPAHVHERQDCGTVHVHPNGRFVYVANRNDGYLGGHKGPSWLVPDPIPVFPGGENSIAVFQAHQDGSLTLLQIEETRGLHPRTFALDPTGRLLIAANLAPTRMPGANGPQSLPASLALFRVGDDGRLTFLRRHDLEVGQEMVWWMGVTG